MFYIIFIIITISVLLFIIKAQRRNSFIIMLLILLLLLIIYPGESLKAAKNGINLWLFIVIPSLLPFFIINDMLIHLKIPENISKLFTPIAKIMFNTPGYGAYVFIMSIFSGYPTGAKVTAELIKQKKISISEGQKILTFSSTSGPLFIVGAVGVGMFKSITAGYILLVSHIIAAVVNGILFRNTKINYKHFDSKNVKTERDTVISTIGEMISDSIGSSLKTCGFIGGYIILFSVIIQLLNKISFFEILSIVLNKILFLPHNIAVVVSKLLETSLEMTNGCQIISNLNIELSTKIIFASFIIAFSGLSVIGQVSSVISNTGLNIKKYILAKLSHGIIASIISIILLNMKQINTQVFQMRSITAPSYIIINIELLLIILLTLNLISYIAYRIKKIL